MVRLTVVKITGILFPNVYYPPEGVVNIVGKKWSTSPEQVVKMGIYAYLATNFIIL